MVGFADIHLQCFKDTVSAYQKVRQDGELHIPAFMAVLKAYKKHEGKGEDTSRQVQGTSPLRHHSTLRSTGRVFGINGG